MVMMASSSTAQLSPEVGLQNVFNLAEGAGDCLDPIAVEKLDRSRSHPARDHYIRFLGMDEFRNFPRDMILKPFPGRYKTDTSQSAC
jgi:hypothetical protein